MICRKCKCDKTHCQMAQVQDIYSLLFPLVKGTGPCPDPPLTYMMRVTLSVMMLLAATVPVTALEDTCVAGDTSCSPSGSEMSLLQVDLKVHRSIDLKGDKPEDKEEIMMGPMTGRGPKIKD